MRQLRIFWGFTGKGEEGIKKGIEDEMGIARMLGI
jgi:hypothetical protein